MSRKYNVSVQCIEPGAMGINMTVQVDADNVLDATVKAQAEIKKSIEASGLAIAPVVPASSVEGEHAPA